MLKATFKIVSGNVAWGGIYGNIEDQTDLIGKFNDVQAEIDDTTGLVDNLEIRLSALGKTVDDNYADLNERVNSNYNAITNHVLDLNNPHEVTKAQIGLSNVDNTSDLNKPISTATQTALNGLDDKITVNSGLINDLDIRLSALGSTVQQDYIELDNKISANSDNISDIQDLIPNQATSSNQLADKDFVNSSISTNTANFIGTFISVSALESYMGTVTNNDYAFVANSVITDNGSDWATFNDLNAYDKTLLTNFDYGWVINGSNFDLYRFDILNQIWDLRATNISKSSVTLNSAYNRYKATVTGSTVVWDFEFTLNNSSFTASQWEAINSTITQALVNQIGTNQSDIQTINTTLSGFGNIVTHNTSEFATSAQGAKADTAVQPAAIANMQTTTNLVTSVSSSSTDSQYPSAKLFYDTVGNLETLLHTINSGNN
jgi:hypothetical protein